MHAEDDSDVQRALLSSMQANGAIDDEIRQLLDMGFEESAVNIAMSQAANCGGGIDIAMIILQDAQAIVSQSIGRGQHSVADAADCQAIGRVLPAPVLTPAATAAPIQTPSQQTDQQLEQARRRNLAAQRAEQRACTAQEAVAEVSPVANGSGTGHASVSAGQSANLPTSVPHAATDAAAEVPPAAKGGGKGHEPAPVLAGQSIDLSTSVLHAATDAAAEGEAGAGNQVPAGFESMCASCGLSPSERSACLQWLQMAGIRDVDNLSRLGPVRDGFNFFLREQVECGRMQKAPFCSMKDAISRQLEDRLNIGSSCRIFLSHTCKTTALSLAIQCMVSEVLPGASFWKMEDIPAGSGSAGNPRFNQQIMWSLDWCTTLLGVCDKTCAQSHPEWGCPSEWKKAFDLGKKVLILFINGELDEAKEGSAVLQDVARNVQLFPIPGGDGSSSQIKMIRGILRSDIIPQIR